MALDDWADVMKANIEKHKEAIQGNAAMMVGFWNRGKYYEAGEMAAIIASMQYEMPTITTPAPVKNDFLVYSAANDDILVFKQTAGFNKWVLDKTNTYADPSYPVKGTVVKFTVSGIFYQEYTLSKCHFDVFMNGTELANLPEPCVGSVKPGDFWTKTFAFPVPDIAPSGTYDVKVSGDAV